MLKRYHKKVFFPPEDAAHIQRLSDLFNQMEGIGYYRHCLANIRHRVINQEELLTFIRDSVVFNAEQVFEYYKEGDDIEKLCYRIPYGERLDLILVLDKRKCIVTIYLNSQDDQHETLNENLYCLS